MPVLEQMQAELVPSPAQYDVLLPPSYGSGDKTYPLLFWLHGGGGPDGFLQRQASRLTSMWSQGTLSQMVVVTPHSGKFPNNYLDFPDGSRHWESWIAGELLDHLRTKYRIAQDRRGTFIGGVSMGGLGSLTIGLKHLDIFAAIIAFEPQLSPSFNKPEYSPAFYDQAFHDKNQPANIVRDSVDAIRNSGIEIYFDIGSEDAHEFFHGTNLLHNTLFANNVRHEYKYVSRAYHLGESFEWRIPDGMAFLERVINPPGDPIGVEYSKRIREQKTKRKEFLRERWNLIGINIP